MTDQLDNTYARGDVDAKYCPYSNSQQAAHYRATLLAYDPASPVTAGLERW